MMEVQLTSQDDMFEIQGFTLFVEHGVRKMFCFIFSTRLRKQDGSIYLRLIESDLRRKIEEKMPNSNNTLLKFWLLRSMLVPLLGLTHLVLLRVTKSDPDRVVCICLKTFLNIG